MDELEKIPEAKYIMDDLMERTEKAEYKITKYKKDSVRLIHKLIVETSLIQTAHVGVYPIDRMQSMKKEIIMENLIKLLELSNKVD